MYRAHLASHELSLQVWLNGNITSDSCIFIMPHRIVPTQGAQILCCGVHVALLHFVYLLREPSNVTEGFLWPDAGIVP